LLIVFPDTGLLEIGSRIVEQLAAKDEDLSQPNKEEDPAGVPATEALKIHYLLLRIALVSV